MAAISSRQRLSSTIRERLAASCRLIQMAAITLHSAAHLWLASAVAGAGPGRSGRHGQRWARRVLRALRVDVHVEGAPQGGQALLVANHRSYLDIPLLLAVHPVAFLAKAEVARAPVLGAAARLAGTVFVARESGPSRTQARSDVAEHAAAGHSFAVFPEGTTTTGPGCLAFRRGIFEVAAQAGLPVVPVALVYDRIEAAYVGQDRFVPHALRLFGRGRLRATVRVGPALTAGDAQQLHAQAERWVRTQLGALEPVDTPAQRERVPTHAREIQQTRAAPGGRRQEAQGPFPAHNKGAAASFAAARR